jgi:hypothetical protein
MDVDRFSAKPGQEGAGRGPLGMPHDAAKVGAGSPTSLDQHHVQALPVARSLEQARGEEVASRATPDDRDRWNLKAFLHQIDQE